METVCESPRIPNDHSRHTDVLSQQIIIGVCGQRDNRTRIVWQKRVMVWCEGA